MVITGQWNALCFNTTPVATVIENFVEEIIDIGTTHLSKIGNRFVYIPLLAEVAKALLVQRALHITMMNPAPSFASTSKWTVPGRLDSLHDIIIYLATTFIQSFKLSNVGFASRL